MGIRFLKIAAVYLAIGVSMGLAMGIMQNFALHPVHAHINLLGFATMALAGLIYVQFPAAAETRLAKIHFWVHNAALPVMMVALAFLLSGYEKALYFLEPASTAMVIAILLFVVNVCINVRPESEARKLDARRVGGRPVTAGAVS
jgi:hypothetical protein